MKNEKIKMKMIKRLNISYYSSSKQKAEKLTINH